MVLQYGYCDIGCNEKNAEDRHGISQGSRDNSALNYLKAKTSREKNHSDEGEGGAVLEALGGVRAREVGKSRPLQVVDSGTKKQCEALTTTRNSTLSSLS